eukprot:GEMP01095588.1.p3 GENE.GEMP01095588.1~~GEMP01095588.1.p3  ORF type:complete len:127 (+),score=24.30 GEMP01095588.1:105-485(+)
MKFIFSLIAACAAKHLFLGTSGLDINQQVFIEGTQVLGGASGEAALNLCQTLAQSFVKEASKPNVKVCGTNIKATFYLRGRCEDYHKYQYVVGSCDTSLPSNSCQEFTPESDANFGAVQSYQIEQC